LTARRDDNATWQTLIAEAFDGSWKLGDFEEVR
jgi:hypothetical protein